MPTEEGDKFLSPAWEVPHGSSAETKKITGDKAWAYLGELVAARRQHPGADVIAVTGGEPASVRAV